MLVQARDWTMVMQLVQLHATGAIILARYILIELEKKREFGKE